MLELFGIAAVGFWLAKWFQPIQAVKDVFFEKYPFKYDYVFYCSKCVTFWLALIITQNIFESVICSLLAYMIQFIVTWCEENWPE